MRPGPLQSWGSLGLVDALLFLSDRIPVAEVREVFDNPSKNCPETLLATLCSSEVVCPLRQELLDELMPQFLMPHPSSNTMLEYLWKFKRDLLIDGMVRLFSRDRSTLPRLLDVVEERKELLLVLETRPFSFAIELAALAARREFLNLEMWMGNMVVFPPFDPPFFCIPGSSAFL